MAEASESRTLTMREIVRDANHLAEKRRELDLLRRDDNREWALNREYLRGNQWSFWNRVSNQLESLGVDDGDKPRYKVRLTANVLLPSVQQLVAQMTKTRPVIRATPNSGADRDVKAAQLAERLYEYLWSELGLRSKLQSALRHAQSSQGYWLITWDALAGKSMKVMLNPEEGTPIHDEMLADVYREELRSVSEQMGIPPEVLLGQFEQTLYMGDMNVRALMGDQVWLDPAASNFEDCWYAVCKFPMTVDEIKARYKKDVTPDASTSEHRPAVMYSKSTDDRPKNVRNVYFLYHRPAPHMPKGKYVAWIESPNEILAESDWEFPFTRLPLVKFPGIEREGSVYDEARVTHARPLQKELNNKISKVAEHMNLTMRPQMIAPIGSLRQRLTNEPGAVFEYAPIQGLAPEWRPTPSIPGHVFTYIEDIQRRLDRIFNIMPTERSQLPARTDSGQLVELVQEAVADQISPEIGRMEESLAVAGDLLAAYAQKYYTEPRLLKIKGPGGSVQVQKFKNADLDGGFSFTAEAGSGLPRTRAGQVAQIREMMEMGVLDPREAIQYLPLAGLKGVQARISADEDMAHRRVEKLLKGEPVNVLALQNAIQAVQSGTNPATGEMFMSPEEAIAFVEEQALEPLPFENLSVTAYVLGQHMKSVEFEKYSPDVQSRFLHHFGLIQQGLSATAVTQEQVKVTLGLNGTVGPTVAADILQKKGIRVATPETMSEPPLETSVYDSMDKPDADTAGNDPLTEVEQLMAMQQAQATHDLKQAKAVQSIEHAQESHDERMRQMQQPRPANGR